MARTPVADELEAELNVILARPSERLRMMGSLELQGKMKKAASNTKSLNEKREIQRVAHRAVAELWGLDIDLETEVTFD